MPLLDVVNEKRKEDPNAKVAYHELETDPTGLEAGSFKVNLKHRVYFVPLAAAEEGNDDGSKMSQMSFGCTVPKSVWCESQVAQVIWATKWSLNGLTPVRPLVVSTEDISLAPGKAICVTRPPTGPPPAA